MGGGFEDQKPWMKLAFLVTVLGFTLQLFAIAAGVVTPVRGNGAKACVVISIICYLLGLLLMLIFIYYEEGIKEKKLAKGFMVAFLLAAGAAGVIGIGIWADDIDKSRGEVPPFSTTLGVLGALMAILAGIFGILDVAEVKTS